MGCEVKRCQDGSTPHQSEQASGNEEKVQVQWRRRSKCGAVGPAAGVGAPVTTYTTTLTKTPLGLGCSFDDDSVVTEVRADSQAGRAGIQPGDQVLAVNGESPTAKEGGVAALLQGLPIGISFGVQLSRSAAEQTPETEDDAWPVVASRKAARMFWTTRFRGGSTPEKASDHK